MSGLVSARGVCRTYRSGPRQVRVLDGVDLEIHAGELVLLVGPSGSGKTTLVSVLAGLLRPDAGEVTLAGTPIHGAGESAVAAVRRRDVGFVFQTFHLFEALDALDNVAEPLTLRGVSIREARERASRALAAVGLGDRARHLPSQLSSGQKQRVAIARAFAARPRVLFGDEPTAALDAHTGHEVMQLLRDHVRDAQCALVVTHDLRLRRYADRVIRMEDGRVIEEAA